jgi:hypothetical protein
MSAQLNNDTKIDPVIDWDQASESAEYYAKAEKQLRAAWYRNITDTRCEICFVGSTDWTSCAYHGDAVIKRPDHHTTH